MALEVHIVTPEREVFSGTASDVTVPGWEGEYQVLPGHDLVLSLLRGGIAVVTTDEGSQRYVLGRGFAEVTGDRVVLLADSCETPDAVDKDAAATDLAEAEAAMGNTSDTAEEWDLIEARRELAQARLDV